MDTPPRAPGGESAPEGARGRWLPGARVGPWTLEEELGRGGMGAVFRARGPDGGCAALKLLLERPSSPNAARRFEREASALQALRHPHVVGLLGAAPGPPSWIAMELVEGQSLEAALRGGPLAPARAARIVGEAALGLAQAHACGVVHRDVKPANILLRAGDGSAVVTDFGLARALDDERLTRTGALVGTPGYMSPEQALGAEVGPAADVWSLGVTLYRCLTGQDPFQAEELLALVAAIQAAAPPRPSALRPGIPPDLEATCLACLQADPARRPDAEGLARALLQRRPAARGARGRPAVLVLSAGALLAASVVLLRVASGPSLPAGPSAGVEPPLPEPGGEWRRVWALGAGPAPVALPPLAEAWLEPGRRVEPLLPLRRATPGSSLAGFLGPARALGEGRVAVDWDLPAALGLDSTRPAAQLLQGAPGAGRIVAASAAPEEPAAVHLLTPNDAGTLQVEVGRARWSAQVVTLEWRRVESVDSDLVVFLSGPGGVMLDGRAGVFLGGAGRRPWTPDAEWHHLRLAPDAPAGERLTLDGTALPDLETEPAPGPARVALTLGEVHLALRAVRVEGRPEGIDVPALACAPIDLPGAARLSARWRRTGPDGAGGPVLCLGDEARMWVRLELDERALRLWAVDRLAASLELPAAPAEGVLTLERGGDLLRGALHLPSGQAWTLEAFDPTPLPAPALRPAWGSSGPPLGFGAVEAHAGPLDPERAAWDEGAPPGGPAAGTPTARWRAAALALLELLLPARCPPALVGAPAARKERARALAEELEGLADLLDPPRRADALARSIQARALSADPELAAAAAQRAVAALGASRAAALLATLERVPGEAELVARLGEGYAGPRHPVIQAAGLRALELLCPAREGEVCFGLAVAERHLAQAARDRGGGDPAERERRALELLGAALAHLERATTLGYSAEKLLELRSEVLLDLGRAEEALPLWEQRVRRPAERSFFYSWSRLAECRARLPDLRGPALEASLAALALRPSELTDAVGQRVLEIARRLAAQGDPSERAVALAVQAAIARVAGLEDALRDALERARRELPGSEGRAQDLLLWVLLPPGARPPPPGPGPPLACSTAVLLRARAGDEGARERLRAAGEEDPFVRHLALLDPALAPLVNR